MSTLKPNHQKTDSEALKDLSSAFQDLDIDGEGVLDQASFLTALRMLGVTLPESELEPVFQALDEDQTGMIAYEKLQEFIKIGKIPSTLLNKVKSSGGSTPTKKKRVSVIFNNAGPLQSVNGGKQPQLKFRTLRNPTGPLPSVAESQTGANATVAVKPMDINRIKMVQRAVIVIKKAMSKNIPREEVAEFLRQKGIPKEDIDFAYEKAAEESMTPDQRMKHLTDLAQRRLNELNEAQRMNEYFSQQIATQSEEIELLKELLKKTTDKLVKSVPMKVNEMMSTEAAKELKDKINQATKAVKDAEEQKDEQAASIHKKDLETLQNISECATQQQHFYAYLYFNQLDATMRDDLEDLKEFLVNHEDGDQED